MFNIDVRTALKDSRVKSYEIAGAIKMSETAFSRKMARGELSKQEKMEVFAAIKVLGGGVTQ